MVEQGTHKSLTASAVLPAWERERTGRNFLVDPTSLGSRVLSSLRPQVFVGAHVSPGAWTAPVRMPAPGAGSRRGEPARHDASARALVAAGGDRPRRCTYLGTRGEPAGSADASRSGSAGWRRPAGLAGSSALASPRLPVWAQWLRTSGNHRICDLCDFPVPAQVAAEEP